MYLGCYYYILTMLYSILDLDYLNSKQFDFKAFMLGQAWLLILMDSFKVGVFMFKLMILIKKAYALVVKGSRL